MIDQILNGTLNPDKLITTPEMASLFQRNPQLARTLGPKGLMPSVKRGTVASDVEQAVKEARGGLDWKGDTRGVVRAGAFLSSYLSNVNADFLRMDRSYRSITVLSRRTTR